VIKTDRMNVVIMEDFICSSSGSINQHRCKRVYFVLFVRLALIAISMLYLFVVKESRMCSYANYTLLAIVLPYSFAGILHAMKSKCGKNKELRVFFYIDAVWVTVLCLLTGGYNSDIYLMYFIILFCMGVFGKPYHAIVTGLFSIVLYSFTIIFGDKVAYREYGGLFFRCIFIFATSFIVYEIRKLIIKYEELHKIEFKLARTDKLTGLANRRYYEQKLIEEAQYSKISGMPINILIFDIDNFKRFNDTYGHMWGDKLLELFADIIKTNIRKSDIPIRYGGEEFLILIRDLDRKTAMSVAERIRRQLEKECKYLVNSSDLDCTVTVSCGVSQYPTDSDNIREAIEFADMALYVAKRSGKNTVVCYEEIKQ